MSYLVCLVVFVWPIPHYCFINCISYHMQPMEEEYLGWMENKMGRQIIALAAVLRSMHWALP